jgi:hypothetical protein
VSGCNSVTYKSINYTISTTLNDTVKSYQGCDSLYKTVSIIVNTITPTTNATTVSGCNSVTYKSNLYTSSAILRDTLKSYQGCDSIYNIVNILVASVVATTKTVSLSNCDSVVYLSNTYKSATTLRDTIKSVLGCDSIYNVVQITVTPSPIISALSYNSVVYLGDTLKLNVAASNATGYSWTGPVSFTSSIANPTIANIVMANAGFYVVTASNGLCSKKDSINININNTDIYAISGRIITPINRPVSNAQLTLTGAVNTTTNSNANGYDFKNLPFGNYSVKVKKNNDIKKNNGVSGIDVIIITNHILNKLLITNPYKLIAADANGNKGISNIDLIFMRRLILAIDTTLPLNRLWTFVDSAYVFADTTNPFPFKDSISITNLSAKEKNKTFIGIRLGDVNYDWNTALGRNNTKPLELVYSIENDKSKMDIGTSIRIPITVKNFKQLVTAQYTLNFNNRYFDFVGIENNTLGIEFNAQQAENGKISFLWADAKGAERTFEDGSEVFTLVLRSKLGIVNSGLDIRNLELAISDDITEIEAWDKNYQQHHIILSKKERNNTQNLNEYFSVSPNPTSGEVVVSLTSNSNKKMLFVLNDAAGKMYYHKTVEAVKGKNRFHLNLNKNAKLPTGVYFIKAEGLEGENVKRIVVMSE